MIILAILAAHILAVILMCIALPHIAPLGWQDDTDFHHGEPDLGSFHGQGF